MFFYHASFANFTSTSSNLITDVTASGKFVVLQTILEESVNLGEKVLVFTQSIPTLDLIEKLLFKQNFGWKHERDYFRFVSSSLNIIITHHSIL